MKILADENIPYVEEAFSTLGEVRTIAGRHIRRGELGGAELLLVRSITPVNEALLGGSRVRFVGTATIGVDHVDEAYLLAAGIGFASAPGSNSNSVAEYVTAAALVWGERRGLALAGRTLGVVGVGHVGSKVVTKARALGMRVLCNDPPRQRIEGPLPGFVPLEQLLAEADVVTFHVPLTRTGEDATLQMIDATLLERLGDRVLLINTSRGQIQGTADLLASASARRKMDRRPIDLVIDTWENEPTISLALLEQTMLGTPHIAGYSLDGKVAGTQMIYQAACIFLETVPTWRLPEDLPAPPHQIVQIETADLTDQDIARIAVRHAYDIEWDDAALRDVTEQPAEHQGHYFDGLRRVYPTRREFHAGQIRLADDRPEAARMLHDLGFSVIT